MDTKLNQNNKKAEANASMPKQKHSLKDTQYQFIDTNQSTQQQR